MTFLKYEDYNRAINRPDLDQLINGDRSLLDMAELVAREEVESYLNQRFDVAAMFAQTGDDRNPLLVMWMLDLSLFHLFTRITPRNIPEIRVTRYDTTLATLASSRDAKMTPNLPRLEDEAGDNIPKSRTGGWTRNRNEW